MKCECGHLGIHHVLLPGHPDGAIECYGSDTCECGEWRPRKNQHPWISGEEVNAAVCKTVTPPVRIRPGPPEINDN